MSAYTPIKLQKKNWLCSMISAIAARNSLRLHFRFAELLIAQTFLFPEGAEIQYRWFSQAPDKYFWMFFCNNGTVKTFDSCIGGFVDLQIRDTRPGMTGEINLNGLPWHLIAEDIKFTGIKFEDIKYIWRGPRNCFIFLILGRCILFRFACIQM